MRADPRFKALPAEPATLLTEGKLIDAIKVLRQSYPNMSLREAKDWIDSHLADNPMLRVQIETTMRAQRRKFFFWFFVVDAVIIACVVYWMYYRVPA